MDECQLFAEAGFVLVCLPLVLFFYFIVVVIDRRAYCSGRLKREREKEYLHENSSIFKRPKASFFLYRTFLLLGCIAGQRLQL